VGIAEDWKKQLAALGESAAFRNYLTVRDRVWRMKDQEATKPHGLHSPSDYWQEELENFDYIFDASPLVISKLRHHCYHLTGLRVYEYRSHREEMKRRLEEKLRALIELGGRELLVPESPILGGFGFEVDGQLFNVDTLKFYEVLIAMDRGAILGEFRQTTERRAVWEIGAGWGGFAYQFKSLCPNVTYFVMDFPELFLFSAVYLMTAFPAARVSFWGEEPGDKLFRSWQDVDFVFIPNSALDEFTPERIDTIINMVSFQEMTAAQVDSYVEKAFACGAPYLYSLNRDRSPYNPQMTSVRSIIEKYYWPHEIPILPVSYTKWLDSNKSAKVGKVKKESSELDYRHVVGWRRVQV
jgi:hypothetical protein